MGVAVGSATQVSMFVVPVAVLSGWAMVSEMTGTTGWCCCCLVLLLLLLLLLFCYFLLSLLPQLHVSDLVHAPAPSVPYTCHSWCCCLHLAYFFCSRLKTSSCLLLSRIRTET